MERSTSLSLRGPRVWVPSEKMSLGMGMRPCSNGSLRGCIYAVVLVDEVEGLEGSMESDMAIDVEKESGGF